MKDKDKMILAEYFDKYLDGNLTQNEAHHLEELTKNDEEASKFYFDLTLQNIAIDEHKNTLSHRPDSFKDFNFQPKLGLTHLALAASLL